MKKEENFFFSEEEIVGFESMESNNSRDLEIETSVSKKLDSYGTMEYSVRHLRWLLRLLGVWPLLQENSSSFEKITGKIVRPMAVFYASSVLIPVLAELFAQRASRQELILLVAPLSYQACNVLKHFFLLLRIDGIKASWHHMETDWQSIDNDKDRAIMIKSFETANKVAIVIIISVYVGGTLHNFVLPALADSYLNEFNETVRVLCYPGGDLLFDVQAKIVFQIVFLTYWISDMFVVTMSMALFTLALILLSHICGQIEIVESRLEALIDSDRDVNVLLENRVAFIIRSHARLLKFSIQMEDVLKEACSLEVISDTLIICFLGYVSIADFDNDFVTTMIYVMLIVTISFNLFLYCEIGEVLKTQCQNVGKSAYMIDWYKLPAKTSLDIMMIMNASACPRQLTAGGMLEISRVSFASIMKTSFAYLNMLRTVM